MSKATLLTAFILFSAALAAQPQITSGPANAASYAPATGTGGGIARGSIFVVFGKGMGPATLVQAAVYPLTTSLGETSIAVTAGGVKRNCLMIYTLAQQVAAILPSDTPVGAATLTVTYLGQTSVSVPLTVVESNPGLFSATQNGVGLAIAQKAFTDGRLELASLDSPIKRGTVIVLWATGLGAVTGDESNPLPGPVGTWQVWLGGVSVPVRYAGRSGCCAGTDQVVFTVPLDAAQGCHVPLLLRSGSVTSNFMYLIISDTGVCADPLPSATDLSAVLAQPKIKYLEGFAASLVATTTTPQSPAGTTVPFVQTVSGTGDNNYIRSSVRSARMAPLFTTSADSCTTSTISYANFGALTGTNLNSGRVFAPSGQTADATIRQTGGLPPGQYTFGWPGDSTMGSYAVFTQMPPPIKWTNSSITSFAKSSPLVLQWTGGQSGHFVVADILYADFSGEVNISCKASAGAGSMSIASSVLQQLPASGFVTISLIATGPAAVGVHQPSGIDLSFVWSPYQVGPTRNISFR